MRIMLVDGDWLQSEFAYNALKAGFPDAEVICIKSAGFFLKIAGGYSLIQFHGTDLIVTERHLPLWGQGEEEEQIHLAVKELIRLFPKVAHDWDHQQGGERIVRWLRQRGVMIPVIMYTNSPLHMIASDLQEVNRVFHLMKRSDRGNLISKVKTLMELGVVVTQ